MLGRSILAVAATAVLVVFANAGTAFAGGERFMYQQGLSAGNAYASDSSHTGVQNVNGRADHTHCPTVAQGYGGYTSTPFSNGNFTANSPVCGPGYQSWYPNATSNYYFHGAEYNPNSSTRDYFAHAYYSW